MPLIGHLLVSQAAHTALKGQAVRTLNRLPGAGTSCTFHWSYLPDVGHVVPRELLDCLSREHKASPHTDPQYSLRVVPVVQVKGHRAPRGRLCLGNLHSAAADEGQLGSHQQGQSSASGSCDSGVHCRSENVSQS